MKVSIYESIRSLFLYVLIGGIIAAFYLVWLENETPIRGRGLAFAILYLWGFFTLASNLVWTRVLSKRLELYPTTWRTGLLLACLLAGFWLADNIPVVLPGSGLLKILFFFCAGAGSGILLFALLVFFVTRYRTPNPPVNRRYGWLLFALPMLIAWVAYLLAFWPGMMSADSLDQWGQVLSGQVYDHHPAFHTFTIWLLTRISATPAIVALAQIVALAVMVGIVLAYFETIGIAPFWLWAASGVFALSPVNGTMVNTLWKDVPYSVAMLGFTYLIFRLAHSKGQWIAGQGKWLVVGITAALVPLFRHNGLPVVLITFLVLLLVFRRQWKPLVMTFTLFAVLYYGITGPIFQITGVKKNSGELIEAATSLYGIAARADTGSQADGLLQSMNPLSNDWQCSIIPALYQASNNDQAGDREEELVTKAWNLVEHGPSLLIFNYRCNRSLAWIIWDPNGEVRNPSHAEYWIDANNFGITPASKIPALQTAVTNFVAATAHEPDINWLVWRPALYLYIFLLVIVVAALRQRSPWLLLAAVPVLLQAVGMMFVTMPPNFRYHYLAYVVALTFWPVFFIPSEDPASLSSPTYPMNPTS